MSDEPQPAGLQVADQLWLSEARYRAIVEDQPDLVCRFLPDGTLSYVNNAYCAYFGLRRGDVLGKRYQPVVHPDDLAAVQARVALLSPTNPVVFIENRVFRGDGAVRWTEWSNRALYDGEGRLFELQSTGRDVTARKQADANTARLAAIVASADVAIYATTIEGVITSWNRAAERMFGYLATEAMGQPVGILNPAGDATTDIPNRVGRGETIEHLETEKVTRDGRRIPVSLTVSPITDASGRVIGISRIARDITERKRAERELQERESRFRLMADHAPVLIWVADAGNRAVYFNRPWIEFTGVALDAQLGNGWLSLIHPDERGKTAAYCQQQFERRLPFTIEFRLRHHDEGYRWVQDTGQPLFLPDLTFNGYIGSCVDIQARKGAEAARERAIQRESEARVMAEEASRLKDEFLAVVSHELRTPLNAILGWTHMLREGTVPPASMAKALDTIHRNARMQAQLVEDLLDVSGFMTGKLAMRQEPVDLVPMVRAAVEAVLPVAAGKRIDLRTELPAEAITIWGDTGRLQQALWNLLVNALKFTGAGGRVEVRLRHEDGLAVVTVRDTGIGIPREALPFVFDRFRQVDTRTTRTTGGLGLGLTIVEHVALSHGGSVRADSPGAGQGATFEIVLPVYAAPGSAAVIQPASSESNAG